MELTQTFETTVADRNLDLTARFVVVPGRALAATDRDRTTEDLDLTPIVGVRPGDLIEALALCLVLGEIDQPAIWKQEFVELYFGRDDTAMLDFAKKLRTTAEFAFAEQLVFAKLVPFEQSPLSAESIGAITSASGVGLGAVAGFMIAGSSPILYLTVPAGMILFGAAAAVGSALESGLRERILGLIAPNRTRAEPEARATPSASTSQVTEDKDEDEGQAQVQVEG